MLVDQSFSNSPAVGCSLSESTQWDLVRRSSQPGSPQAEAAREQFCQLYWNWLCLQVCRSGYAAEKACDLTQQFFAQLLHKNCLARADVRKGRSRTFLLVCLKNFLAGAWHRAHAAKRYPGLPLVSLDGDEAEETPQCEPASDHTPERDYDRQCALALLDRALARLKNEMAAKGQAREYELMKDFLSDNSGTTGYVDLTEELGLKVATARMRVHRLRQRFAVLVREELAATLAAAADVDSELHCLLAALS